MRGKGGTEPRQCDQCVEKEGHSVAICANQGDYVNASVNAGAHFDVLDVESRKKQHTPRMCSNSRMLVTGGECGSDSIRGWIDVKGLDIVMCEVLTPALI